MRRLPLITILIVAGACSPEASDGTARTYAPPQATLAGKKPQHMRNCPSAIEAAATAIQPTPDGIELTITSSDADARRQIVKLAELQSGQREPMRFMPEHSGLHGGPGTSGYCPVIHTGTIVTYREIPEGVTIHVMARFLDEVWLLQRATETRAHALTRPAS